jgi:hypothetical protein
VKSVSIRSADQKNGDHGDGGGATGVGGGGDAAALPSAALLVASAVVAALSLLPSVLCPAGGGVTRGGYNARSAVTFAAGHAAVM